MRKLKILRFARGPLRARVARLHPLDDRFAAPEPRVGCFSTRLGLSIHPQKPCVSADLGVDSRLSQTDVAIERTDRFLLQLGTSGRPGRQNAPCPAARTNARSGVRVYKAAITKYMPQLDA